MPVMKDDDLWFWSFCDREYGKRYGWKRTKEQAEKAETDERERLAKLAASKGKKQ